MKRYAVRPYLDSAARQGLAPYSDLTARLLYHRGVTEAAQAQIFLNPEYDRDTHDPFLLKDADRAAERILKAIAENQKVVIYSDYDTDGIPGGVILHDFFKKVGFTNFTNYIPHRHDEGFGVHEAAVLDFAEQKVELLITIDCGIADVASVTLARDKGIDVIITDHHLPSEILPPAYAIVNPKQKDCQYPEKMLCGSGVIFKLVQALVKKGKFTMNEGWEKWLLDMVGIATLSDMVPLTGENRVFARYGLLVLRKTPRIGLVRLLAQLKITQKHLTEDDIGFMISPRINAASRMGVPMDAFNLLVATDETVANGAAKHLNAINDERKGVVGSLVKQVKHTLAERYGSGSIPKVIVLGNPDWRPSLLGLAANSLAEEYVRPVFLWGRDGDGGLKGSCRSDGVTSLIALMQKATPAPFAQFGGHAQSGGFAVTHEKVHTLPEVMAAAFDALGQEQVIQTDHIDAELFLDDVTWKMYAELEALAPFGTGNPKPIFILRNVIPVEVRAFGKEKTHTEMVFMNKYGKLPAIGFFMKPEDLKTEKGDVIAVGQPLTLVAAVEKSMFRGRAELRLRIVDIL